MVKIAKAPNLTPRYADLNRRYFGRQKVAPPSGLASGWSPTLIRVMLYRRLCSGEVIWGRTTYTNRNGRAGVLVRRPEKEWIKRDPSANLRIIEEPLWTAVQARLKALQLSYLRDRRGKLWSNPDVRKEGCYQLSGLAECAHCKSRVNVLGDVPRIYGCTEARWKKVCKNRLTQRVDVVDAAFLTCLEKEALTPERIRYAAERGVERVREQLAQDPDRMPALERERQALSQKVGRMLAAIGDGRGPAALVQEIEKMETCIREIDEELSRPAAAPALDNVNMGQVEAAVAAQLTRFQELIRGNVSLSRQALKKLLVRRIVFTPVDLDGGRRTFAFQGELSFGAVIRELVISRKNSRRMC